MIVFDCERMKYPNTGLFVYCDNVAAHLARMQADAGDDMCFYTPSVLRGRWGDSVSYRNVSAFDKIFLHCSKNVKIWHSAHQQTSYMPSSDRVRIVLTVHDLNFLYEKEDYKQKRYLKALQTRIDRADRIVAISQSTKRDILTHLDVRGKDISVIYNGLSRYLGPVSEPVHKPSGEFLYSVGTVLPKKNFHVLPSLLAGNGYTLVISGNISSYADRVIQEAEKYGVRDRVILTGPVSEGEKLWYMKNCSAFMFPSLAEGFGLPVIEAMYCGKPVFLSDRTSLPEIGGSHAFYLDHDFNPEKMRLEFAAGMDAFAKGEKDIQAMIGHADSFSWENTAKEYIRIYKELL